MSKEQNSDNPRKQWQPPVLEQLSVDLSAIGQKLSGKIDSGFVGAIS